MAEDFLYFDKEVKKMGKAIEIRINSEQCRGCRRCALACSWGKEGGVNPRKAGIKIHKLEKGAKDRPMINQQCEEEFCGKTPFEDSEKRVPRCVEACLFGALELVEEVDSSE